jgi:micrococcal nuclease
VSTRRAVFWVAAFCVLALLGGIERMRGPSGDRFNAQDLSSGRVVRVVDGDTVRIRFAHRTETVRYIGVDTPESVKPGTPVQCYAEAASAENRRLVAGREVRLVPDAEARDRYGRLLAYVYREPDGLFVNAELVRRGYARLLTIPPNVAHEGQLRRLARRAKAAGRGLWSRC